MALKPDERGSKCPKHEVFYESEWQESCHKTVEFCPKCREEQYKPFIEWMKKEKEDGRK
jgi:hypothetical protein